MSVDLWTKMALTLIAASLAVIICRSVKEQLKQHAEPGNALFVRCLNHLADAGVGCGGGGGSPGGFTGGADAGDPAEQGHGRGPDHLEAEKDISG